LPSNPIDLEKALGSPGRVRILIEMARNPTSLSVYRLRKLTGLRREDIKRHLQTLVESGVVKEVRAGPGRRYMLNRESPVFEPLLELFRASGSI
jgi:DNA-binding transcriptional ArsR family regulator